MVTRTLSRSARLAAVSASTVFAIALAIVAGLIFAWLFKAVLFAPKPTPPKIDDSVAVTVAATNIYDQWEIKPQNIKTIKVSPDTYKKWTSGGRELLTGQQPVGRMTKEPIMAEKPIYADQLEPFTYPEPLKVDRGYRAAVVTVGPKDAIVRVGDYVDVYCTLGADALGAGVQGNATAQIAKGAKVIARFGTTKHNAQPRDPNAPREYTLQVTPYRYALMELAKKDGATFALTNVPMVQEGDLPARPPEGNDPEKDLEKRSDRVGFDDLAALFGITPPPDGIPPWLVQKVVGIRDSGTTTFPGYVPPSRQGSGESPGNSTQPPPKTESRVKPASQTVPVAYTPPPRRTYNPSGAVASTSRGFGFRAPYDPNAAKGCST